MIIDLRSDTVTKPTPRMLSAMFQAKVGDDVYKEDATVNELESRLCQLFSVEKALFFPSGTMANQAAIKLHTQPGEQVICDKYAHIFNYEGGGVSFNSGVSCKLIDGHRGMFKADQVLKAINPPDFYHSPLSRLVAVENTTNKGGGACWDVEELKRIKEVCREHELGFHMDGARLWNALIEKKHSPKTYGKIFDTISLCFSKGLGCPIGSVLLGSDEIMNKAMRVRKLLGGGMRQVGYFAAAALYALEHHTDRLADDHTKARELGEALKRLEIVSNVEPIETNIVIFTLLNGAEEEFVKKMKERKILLSSMGEGKLRMVTHLDYTDEMQEQVIEALSGC